MAQEDNILNARMAVAATRDSSSMKALAVITAVFLPGEFLGTLFGMSMFDWMAQDAPPDEEPTPSNSISTSAAGEEPKPILSHLFYIYWLVAIPLTIFILGMWRAWWVKQDRVFRRHLSKELSEERYWTSDGQPRDLEHGFWYDFFLMSSRRDEIASAGAGGRTSSPLSGGEAGIGDRGGGGGGGLSSGLARVVGFNGSNGGLRGGEGAEDEEYGNGLRKEASQGTTSIRQRQILTARRESWRQRGLAVAI